MALKRKLKWLGATLASVLLWVAAIWFLWPAGVGDSITVKTYERLRAGMSRSEVEAMLGGPGGTRKDCTLWMDNRSPVVGHGVDLDNGYRDQPGIKYWYQDSGIIVLRFDSDNLVADKQFLQMRVSTSRQKIIRLLERIGW
jgi:hypothetical protein